MIVRAHFLIAARLKASFTVDGMDSHFVEGQELPATVAKRVPAGMVGRVLSAAEAERILDAIEGEAGGTFSKIRYRSNASHMKVAQKPPFESRAVDQSGSATRFRMR
jgi:hypothetical protein